MENWKKIKSFENYEISNFGRVKRNECTVVYSNGQVTKYKLKYLKLENNRFNKLGAYKRVTLCANNKPKRFQVHRLVAEYFIPNIQNKRCVNHIDGNPSNNHISNLEWCTHQENEKHSYDVLGKVCHNRKLTDLEAKYILFNGVKGKKGNVTILMQRYNVTRGTILNIINAKYYAKTTRLSN